MIHSGATWSFVGITGDGDLVYDIKRLHDLLGTVLLKDGLLGWQAHPTVTSEPDRYAVRELAHTLAFDLRNGVIPLPII